MSSNQFDKGETVMVQSPVTENSEFARRFHKGVQAFFLESKGDNTSVKLFDSRKTEELVPTSWVYKTGK